MAGRQCLQLLNQSLDVLLDAALNGNKLLRKSRRLVNCFEKAGDESHLVIFMRVLTLASEFLAHERVAVAVVIDAYVGGETRIPQF